MSGVRFGRDVGCLVVSVAGVGAGWELLVVGAWVLDQWTWS